MAVQNISFVGDSFFSGTHVAGNEIYMRSTSATDAGTVSFYGVNTSGPTLDSSTATLTSSQGTVEALSGEVWDSIALIVASAARVGTTTVYSNSGTAATGDLHFHGAPADGDTLEIGVGTFTDTITFKTTVVGAGQVKVGTAVQMADRVASYLMDTSVGTSTPVDGTDWNAAAANAHVSATAPDGAGSVVLTDLIKCERALAWVTTATLATATDISISAISGGIDGTLIGTIPIAGVSLSVSASDGVNLSTPDSDTLPPSFIGTSNAVPTRGRFAYHVKYGTAASISSLTSKLQISPDNSAWYDAPTTTIADLSSDPDQIFNGTDLFAEYARLVILVNANTVPLDIHSYITYQSR